MSETVSTPKKKAIELATVKIALVLCVIALVALMLPCIHFSDAALIRYRNIEHNDYTLFSMSEIEQPYLIMAIILLVCYLVAAVLFLADHPKFVLIPTIIALLVLFAVLSILSEYSSNGGTMTLWPTIQLISDIALIVFASITKRANPKYIKVKVN